MMKPGLMIFVLGVICSFCVSNEAWAAKESPRYVCLANLQCENGANALTQDLPTDGAGTVRSPDIETAKRDCRTAYASAYQTLERTAPEGCAITSNALKARKSRTPALAR